MSITSANPAHAASAYAQAANRAIDDIASESAGNEAGPSFADLIQDSVSSSVEVGRASETASLNAIAGSADVVDLVTAVNNAEMTLQTVVAVRDRVVQAYQDILKMPI